MREANDQDPEILREQVLSGPTRRVLGAFVRWATGVRVRQVQAAQTADAVLLVLCPQLRPDVTRRLPGVLEWLRELRPDLFPEEAARESRQASDAEA